MARLINNPYKNKENNEIIKKIDEALKDTSLNDWKTCGNSFVYMNSKGYYHVVTILKFKNKVEFIDYILSDKDNNLKFNKEYSVNLEDVKEFLSSKGVNMKNLWLDI